MYVRMCVCLANLTREAGRVISQSSEVCVCVCVYVCVCVCVCVAEADMGLRCSSEAKILQLVTVILYCLNSITPSSTSKPDIS